MVEPLRKWRTCLRMSGNGFDKKALWELLKAEFLIPEELLEARGFERAEASLEIYESVEDFLNRTGWRRNNPECSSEEYLIKMRICRWVDGKFLYFSRIVWEDGDMEGKHG